uniref:Uncharacterized protein n=1 Tax=Rhizophora mucronata TaxID=61149 RepID=A0A2P2QKU6_RHIMU
MAMSLTLVAEVKVSRFLELG